MKEIRIHGRGGQGAVTTGQLIAIAAFYDGKESQTFPHFGVERAGAPVETFVRISDEKINLRSHVYEPDIVIVLEPTLLEVIDVTKGLKKGGTLIINSKLPPEKLGIKGKFNIHTIDATHVALEIFKRPIVNTPMLGAFCKVTGEISLKSMLKAVDEIFIARKGREIAELNKKAVERVYEETR